MNIEDYLAKGPDVPDSKLMQHKTLANTNNTPVIKWVPPEAGGGPEYHDM